MASLELRNKGYRLVFRWRGRKLSYSLKTENPRTAEAFKGAAELQLTRLEQGLAELPHGVDIIDYLKSQGKASKATTSRRRELQTFDSVRERFERSREGNVLEPRTIKTTKMHLRHLRRTLGGTFRLESLSVEDLQRHVHRRSKDPGVRDRTLNPATIRMELVTFRILWNFGVREGLLAGKFPLAGVQFPKRHDKPPFQTYAEIERQIRVGKLSPSEAAELWDCLFLSVEEMEELLASVKSPATPTFLYPMVATAIYTGARRSELCRLRIIDIDFDRQSVHLSEAKRKKGVRSYRRVPLAPKLAVILSDWIGRHPGGTSLFADPNGRRSRSEAIPVVPAKASNALDRSLESGKWRVVRGWHTFRHSFVSNAAARGVDQRLIQAWAGHMSEEMSARYRHLFPEHEARVMQAVFG
jgi:integrase